MIKQDLYVSISPEDYKENKQELLNTEIALLNVLKHLEIIRQIRREKAALKMLLKEQIDSAIERVAKLRAELPEIPAEKHFHGIHEKHMRIKEIIKESSHAERESERKFEQIEKELLEINSRLKVLNS
jgi:vacuolar-type H+-ATPase subunit I/STV1